MRTPAPWLAMPALVVGSLLATAASGQPAPRLLHAAGAGPRVVVFEMLARPT